MTTSSPSHNPIARYVRWLHTQWPAGTVERLPRVNPDGSTNVRGVYVVGDLTGIPLLKFSADTGARAVQTIVSQGKGRDGVLDLVVIGGGVSGMAAALEARRAGLTFEILESTEPFSTLINFPKGKPIYTYPTDMTPAGALQFKSDIKEGLVEEVRAQTRGITPRMARAERIVRKGDRLEVMLADQPSLAARNVIIAIGRSGNFRKLNVPGEDLDKVYNRLHDPKEFAHQNVLVVGGGDSALETAIAIAEVGGNVTLSYRKPEFSRPKSENVEKLNRLVRDPMADVQIERPSSERVTTAMGGYMSAYRAPGSIRLMLPSRVKEIRERDVVLTDANGRDETIANDAVFTMIGREAPLDFFRRSGLKINGERNARWWSGLIAFVLFCFWLYHWKSGHAIPFIGALPTWLNFDTAAMIERVQNSIGAAAHDRSTLLGTILNSARGHSFYYTLAYSLIIVVFGILRIRRRKTPYVKWQTLTLTLIQCIPLFILPEIILPYLGANYAFDHGFGKWIAATFFPGESWWRAYGLVLAWPLFVYNWFTDAPIWGWLILGAIQTFVLIPGMVYFWGKGAYCGWICSCGALAETLGDNQRHKMPHGPGWNRLNMLGQIVLAFAGVLMILRIIGWTRGPDSWAALFFKIGFEGPLGYGWTVDLLLAGILGYGMYFWLSGRVWCRFACPLAALMHIYARFSRFRILADKKKCISCNVCTSVCHQGIDVMNFANKGMPMKDPECVRCSACVQMCPTGVLSFGQVDRATGEVIKKDPAWLAASPVLMHEIHVNGKKMAV